MTVSLIYNNTADSFSATNNTQNTVPLTSAHYKVVGTDIVIDSVNNKVTFNSTGDYSVSYGASCGGNVDLDISFRLVGSTVDVQYVAPASGNKTSGRAWFMVEITNTTTQYLQFFVTPTTSAGTTNIQNSIAVLKAN
jgi:hypothetical protein